MTITQLSGRWVPATDAAAFLGITTAALKQRRYREAGQHPTTVRIGPAVLYDEAALQRYAQTGRGSR